MMPSIITVQAPQSPVAQPSLVPAEHQFVAQDVEQRLLRLAQELVFVAVDGRGDVMFLGSLVLPCPFERLLARCASPARPRP